MSDNLRLKDLPGCSFHFLTEDMIARAHLSAEQAVALEAAYLEREYRRTGEEIEHLEWRIASLDTGEGVETERHRRIAERDDAVHALDDLSTPAGIERTAMKYRESLGLLMAEHMVYENALETLQEWSRSRDDDSFGFPKTIDDDGDEEGCRITLPK